MENVHVDVEHTRGQEADQAKAILTTLLAAYDESVVDNALFQQTASAAVQAALSGSTAEEVLKCMLEIPSAHPGMPEACRLSLNAFRQEGSDERHRKHVVTFMTAVRKAATTTVAWVIGLNPDAAVIDPSDENWLTFPELEKADGITLRFWTLCSALVGVVLAQKAAEDHGAEATDFDPDIYNGVRRAYSKLEDLHGSDVNIVNLSTYAQYIGNWVHDEAGFHKLTEALIEKEYLDGQEVKDLLTQNDLSAESIRFHHRSWPDGDIGLEAAMALPANDPSLAIYVFKT